MKRTLLLLVLSIGLIPFAAAAQSSGAVQAENASKQYTAEALRSTIDSHLAWFEENSLRFMDIRISPMILAENHYEIPVEMSLLLTEDQIPTFLHGLKLASKGKLNALPMALNISVSAETAPGGHPLLSLTALLKLNNIDNLKPDPLFFKVFEALAKATTFSPQIVRDQGIVKDHKSVWIANLRIDSDRRVQMTGYALKPQQVNQISRDLEGSGYFTDLWLSSMTRNVYEKQPVIRFDLTGRVVKSEK
jgi:hypothetical protein